MRWKIVDFNGFEVRIDEERTRALYKGFSGDWCQCEGCTNGRMTRKLSTPPKQAQILESMGLDSLTPYETWMHDLSGDEPPGFGRRLKCWFAFGQLIGAESTPEFGIDVHNWMWIETRRDKVDALLGNLTQRELQDPDLIYIFASNAEPWFYGEVEEEFIYEPNRVCTKCHRKNVVSADLKPISRIPEWKSLPHLQNILVEGKHHVRVFICEQCGELEYELTPI